MKVPDKASHDLLYYLHLERKLKKLSEIESNVITEDDLLEMMDYVWWKLDKSERDWINSRQFNSE